MLIPGPSTQKPSAHMATHEYKSIKTSRSVRYNDAIEIWNEELCLCDRTKVPKQLHSSRKARDGRHPARISKRDKTNPSYSIDRWLAAGPQDSPPTISTAYQDRAWAAANKAEEMILQGGMKVQMAPPKLDDDIVCLGTWADDELDEYYDPYVMVAIETNGLAVAAADESVAYPQYVMDNDVDDHGAALCASAENQLRHDGGWVLVASGVGVREEKREKRKQNRGRG